ncbi:putative CFEM domain-containing protein [Rosellinia necatrix]|uniref:Putative CFEM domain-containing protein n=1 Tax=Rosellinia necatrix TaxID=77044 RepID=A0A1W2TQP6_ROSNE|nr:putative CFEM domain-containing protein [Rosellinia necatrix]
MQFKVVALSFFAAVATAQTNSTSLPDLVSQLPTCAIPCYTKGAAAANCSTTDFQCLCGDGKSAFLSSAATCIFTSCSGDDTSNIVNLATEICTDVSQNPDPTEVASASAIITSALGAASATNSPDSAASRPEFVSGVVSGIGIVGVAAAMLAL